MEDDSDSCKYLESMVNSCLQHSILTQAVGLVDEFSSDGQNGAVNRHFIYPWLALAVYSWEIRGELPFL